MDFPTKTPARDAIDFNGDTWVRECHYNSVLRQRNEAGARVAELEGIAVAPTPIVRTRGDAINRAIAAAEVDNGGSARPWLQIADALIAEAF